MHRWGLATNASQRKKQLKDHHRNHAQRSRKHSIGRPRRRERPAESTKRVLAVPDLQDRRKDVELQVVRRTLRVRDSLICTGDPAAGVQGVYMELCKE